MQGMDRFEYDIFHPFPYGIKDQHRAEDYTTQDKWIFNGNVSVEKRIKDEKDEGVKNTKDECQEEINYYP